MGQVGAALCSQGGGGGGGLREDALVRALCPETVSMNCGSAHTSKTPPFSILRVNPPSRGAPNTGGTHWDPAVTALASYCNMAAANHAPTLALAILRAVATECRAFAADFSVEQAAEGLGIPDELHALFQRSASASSAVAGPGTKLQEVLPPELWSIILSKLSASDLARLAATCRSLWCGAPTPPSPLPTLGLVETELRRRAAARGLHIGSSLPEGALSWVPYLLRREFYDALRREAPLAAGPSHRLFVDREGRLHLACRRHTDIQAGMVGEPLLGHDWGLGAGTPVSIPLTLVPSMQDKRIVSVASSCDHCLALSAAGEVYSWGSGEYGVLGHADGSARAGPRRIEMLEKVESIAAGYLKMSAAVDDRGRLFTWGLGDKGGMPTRRGRARPRLAGERGAAPAGRSPGENGAAVRRHCRQRLHRTRAD